MVKGIQGSRVAEITSVDGLPFTRLEVFEGERLLHDAEYDSRSDALAAVARWLPGPAIRWE